MVCERRASCRVEPSIRFSRGGRVRSAASARDIGWWGEKSEERVFHEMANMREIALDKRMKTKKTETKNGRFTRDASGERETEGDATTTAFRLSKRGLRY
jgi:hypothetical protein